jgi:GMP synthase-like glutamine amidotransferase
VSFEIITPEEVERSSADGFDGVIASGGYLRASTYKRDLRSYTSFLEALDRPFLGICLGLKILGHYYGARMRRIEPAVGMHPLHFQKDYPLLPGVVDCRAYQGHKYELIQPLPPELENYAADASPVQAVKVRRMARFGVQFHPELSEEPVRNLIKNFVSMC